MIDSASVWQSNQLVLVLIFLLFAGLALLLASIALYHLARYLCHYFSVRERRQRRIQAEQKKKRQAARKRSMKNRVIEFKPTSGELVAETRARQRAEQRRREAYEAEKSKYKSDRPDWLG